MNKKEKCKESKEMKTITIESFEKIKIGNGYKQAGLSKLTTAELNECYAYGYIFPKDHKTELFKRGVEMKTLLNNFRELAKQNIMYNTETKTLTIKEGRMKGIYANINIESAIEIAKAN